MSGLALGAFLAGLPPDPVGVVARAEGIRAELLARSPVLDGGDFTRIGVEDLARMYALYDRDFFGGNLELALDGRDLGFRLSKRMTRTGGKFTWFRPRTGRGAKRFEISVSSHLLFSGFRPGEDPVEVNGLECADRLAALQRIFEHELAHLAEYLATGRTSCRRKPFRALCHRLFGHTDVTHGLPTAARRASRDRGVIVGSPVVFPLEGRRHRGRVNRITKRATVLVEDPRGPLYTDGKRYAKYYVPVECLELVRPPPF